MSYVADFKNGQWWPFTLAITVIALKKGNMLLRLKSKLFFCFNTLHDLFSYNKSDYLSFFLRAPLTWVGVLNWALKYWEVSISKIPKFQEGKKKEHRLFLLLSTVEYLHKSLNIPYVGTGGKLTTHSFHLYSVQAYYVSGTLRDSMWKTWVLSSRSLERSGALSARIKASAGYNGSTKDRKLFLRGWRNLTRRNVP